MHLSWDKHLCNLGLLNNKKKLTYIGSLADRTTTHEQQQQQNRHGRYLWVNESNANPFYSMVFNATTVAIGAFYFGSIGLGIYSVLNEAANSVAKHKKAKSKLQDADAEQIGVGPIDLETYDTSDDSDLEEYEKQLHEYEQAYDAYLKSYQDWAEQYGQDPEPPSEKLARHFAKR